MNYMERSKKDEKYRIQLKDSEHDFRSRQGHWKKEYSLFTRAVFWKKILLKYISFINRAVQGIAS